MKNNLLFILIYIWALNISAQNSLTNGSFENCNSPCPTFYTEGEFGKVTDWNDFGHNTSVINSVDLWDANIYTPQDFGAQSGDKYACFFDNEGIYYDFGSSGIRTSVCKLSFWLHGDAGNVSYSPAHAVSVYLTTIPPTNATCNSIAGGEVYLLGRPVISGYQWTKVELEFPVYNGAVPYRYLVITGYRDGNCDRYMCIDNVVLEDECCAQFMLYQHCDYLPKYTSRQDFIKAGYNVGCVHQPVGDVTVKNGQDVTFQSENYIDIRPGFNIEPGATYTAQIGSCGDVPTNALNDTNLLFYSNAAFFTCDGNHNNAVFTSTGFSYYRVRIFNRWGEKVLDQMGHIDEIFTLYASGAEIYTDVSQGLFTVQLELFNCDYYKVEAFSMFYEYVDPCISAYFKNDLALTEELLSSAEHKNSGEIKIYPNPGSDLINLCYTTSTNQNVSFAIHNELGQLIYEKDNIPVINNNQMHIIPTDKLPNGEYFLALYKDGTKFMKKFIIKR